jgi:hypothetical protein
MQFSAIVGYEASLPRSGEIPDPLPASHMTPFELGPRPISTIPPPLSPTPPTPPPPPRCSPGPVLPCVPDEVSADKRFKCSACPKRFKFKNSVGKHFRKQHDSNKCSYCDFRWGGPYDYGNHLKNKHNKKDEEITKILGKRADSRCRAKISGRKPFLPQSVIIS